MATLALVEVGEMETTESAELFRKCAKLKSPQLRVNAEVYRWWRNWGGLRWRSRWRDRMWQPTVKVGHPLISVRISRTTETVIKHEGKS